MNRLIFFVLLIGLIYPTIIFSQNKALSLDGDGDYVRVPHSQTLNLFGFSQKKVFYDGTGLKSCVGFGLSALLTTYQEFRAWKPVHSINKK